MLSIITYTPKATFSASFLTQLQKLHNQKRFYQMLGLKPPAPFQPRISKAQLKKTYIQLMKKYHSDRFHHSPEIVKQYEEISKLIISAYYNLEKINYPEERFKNQHETEDSICKDLFGKTYHESKYEMYKPGNQRMKERYLQELARRTGKPYERPKTQARPRPRAQPKPQEAESIQNSLKQKKAEEKYVLGITAIAIIALGALFLKLSRPKQSELHEREKQKMKKNYEKKIEQIQERRAAVTKKKSDAMIKSLLKDQPPCLRYPDREPHLFTQLIQYSIAPDIHLYEVPGEWYEQEFIEQVNVNPNLIKEKDLFRLNRIKPNTVLTLSLQAERALQNIYVKVRDVIKEIEEKGKYTPPKVFTRFHGYIMFQLRDKPISLKNYKDTEYISLFDLYFDYYSPIFLKKDQFCQYLVGKDEPQLFGWVHINYRKCQPQYLKNGQKYVYFISKRLPIWEDANRKIWNGYYKRYEDRWKPGGNSKSRVGI